MGKQESEGADTATTAGESRDWWREVAAVLLCWTIKPVSGLAFALYFAISRQRSTTRYISTAFHYTLLYLTLSYPLYATPLFTLLLISPHFTTLHPSSTSTLASAALFTARVSARVSTQRQRVLA